MRSRAPLPPRRRFGRDREVHVPHVSPDLAEGAAPSGPQAIGLDPEEAADFLAVCQAAERGAQPDRLWWALGAALVVLLALAASGVPQRLWREARERGIQRLVDRPDLKRGWKARLGVTREDLGLQPLPPGVKPMRPAWQWF